MNNLYKKTGWFYLFAFSFIIMISSCRTPQNVIYFSDLDSTKVNSVPLAKFKEPLIQTDDILSINIQTLDLESTPGMGASATSGAASPGGGATDNSSQGKEANATSGFLVDEDGNVEIPMIGSIKLAGLTTNQARELVRTKAAKYFKDPTVEVRFANYKITMLGEVNRPSTYTVPYKKVTVLDAISMAGDLTIYGKRENVLLMRENGDKKDVVRLNLNSSTLMASEYYYLKQNDIIYVQPSKAKSSANDADRVKLITILISVATLLTTILIRL
ncbi:polysaccharide biosynthesis/export family protein [Pedobacter sp. MC2016-15]|uniref:polysaccharide biosynthesis/export family protein n=1 Tax=Pedobacter sp. MC2016-15 TaxID=2994473 RepID=UPI0022480FBC|nr:polysaccharide biosynthesis/export family protein [Pedobacter sp. MC2016-15]MCX2481161.1 polysaccharide biosynthesis/export family protein [Pedobacter sp. MC2016-15]